MQTNKFGEDCKLFKEDGTPLNDVCQYIAERQEQDQQIENLVNILQKIKENK